MSREQNNTLFKFLFDNTVNTLFLWQVAKLKENIIWPLNKKKKVARTRLLSMEIVFNAARWYKIKVEWWTISNVWRWCLVDSSWITFYRWGIFFFEFETKRITTLQVFWGSSIWHWRWISRKWKCGKRNLGQDS